VLKNQQELYVKEGLDWTKIDFYDNQPICDLIDKVNLLHLKLFY
jgi:myosin heavy subunit